MAMNALSESATSPNNSRTWDGFFGHFGDGTDKNNVDVFSTSVVTVHPTSLDTHGAGLTFHGVYGPSVHGFQIPCSSRLFWSKPSGV
jgi:hypothetical protein